MENILRSAMIQNQKTKQKKPQKNQNQKQQQQQQNKTKQNKKNPSRFRFYVSLSIHIALLQTRHGNVLNGTNWSAIPTNKSNYLLNIEYLKLVIITI